MATVTGYRTPEEAALELELPLLGVLCMPAETAGPVATSWLQDDVTKREVPRIVERIFELAVGREGGLGVLGDVAAEQRARVASTLAASFAAERTTVLVDADLRHAFLSFDDRRRAQEGLVDVLRYGVRSPRVVAPTLTPGLTLLPVGSRTVDLAGTFGAEAVPGLFAELRRSGDVVLVNGPDLADIDHAARLVDEVGAWVLVHELGASDPERTRALRDHLGRSACVGILVLDRSDRATSIPDSTSEEELDLLPRTPAPRIPESTVPPTVPVPAAPVLAAPVLAAPVLAAPVRARDVSPLAAVERAMEAAESSAPTAETGAMRPGPTRFRIRGILIAASVAAAATLALAYYFRSARGTDTTQAPAETSAPAALVPPGTTPGPTDPATLPGSETDAIGSQEASPGIAVEPDVAPAGPTTDFAQGMNSGSEPAIRETVTPPTTTDPAAAQTPSTAGPSAQSAPVAPAPQRVAPAEAVARDGVVFAVHVSSVKTLAGAQRDVAAFTTGQRTAFLKRTEIPDKGTWYRVYVGPFAVRDEAERVAAALRKEGHEYAQVHRVERNEIGDGTGREER